MKTWKANWEESRQRYIDWWNRKGVVVSMWQHLLVDSPPHVEVPKPPAPRDLDQYWFDPVWRADNIHYELSRSSLKADIPPVANTQLGPGSLAAILGSELAGGEDSIWFRHAEGEPRLEFDETNPNWLLHRDLLLECKKRSQGQYFVGCPDLIEGLDVLASIRGTEDVLVDTILAPERLEEQLQKVNDAYFQVFDRVYEIIREGDEMAFCYFSLWAPGRCSKLQSDISLMISGPDFERFVIPYIREQCRKIEYTMYHLDGVDAIRHLDAVLEIEELNAVQWTPGIGKPQGGDPCWYDMYRKIIAAGKSVMPCWVEVGELRPLLESVGADGLNILMHFRTEKDIDDAWEVVSDYR